MTTPETPAPVTGMPRIGEQAPSFTAVTTQGPINFPADYAGKWVIFFSHPADFTPVCTSEFITFASMREQFAAYNTELVGLSVDGLYSHIAWLRTIKEKITFRDMHDVDVTFPLIEDVSMKIAEKYGMIMPGEDSTKAVRAVFVIDPQQDPGDHLLPAEPRPQFRRIPAGHQGPSDRRPLRGRHARRLASRRSRDRATARLVRHGSATDFPTSRGTALRGLVLLHQGDRRRGDRVRDPRERSTLMDVPEVDPIEAIQLLNEAGAVLLDVREDDEWSAGHAPRAIHVPLGTLDTRSFDTTVPVVAVCRSGKRSGVAAGQLAAAGVTVYNLAGGMKAWMESGQPVIRDDYKAATII